MMPVSKTLTQFVCQECGHRAPRWTGRCPGCGEWNTFAEEIVQRGGRSAPRQTAGNGTRIAPLSGVDLSRDTRLLSGMQEFDRVVGGGLVPGSVIILGGDPGIGKSTIMLQIADRLHDKPVLYVAGEESPKQIKLRSERLALERSDNILVYPETDLFLVQRAIEAETPGVVIVDSIQTMQHPDLQSVPGTVGQLRECTAGLIKIAKKLSLPLILIGHVTKEGMLAGPKAIEHMVDAVLQFEGDRHYAYRILRALKNRYGSTNEIGIFEMHEKGLAEVQNPSRVFLSERKTGGAGSVVVPTIEGSRPILIEVQSLVSTSNYGMPQRTTSGFDQKRLALLLAVLEKRMGYRLGAQDVFVNIAGGMRIDEPAVDLAVAIAVVSSFRDAPVDPYTVAIGETGLGGEIRGVSQIEQRLYEAQKLGFNRAIVPRSNVRDSSFTGKVELIPVDRIDEAIDSAVR
jgi:DNA repair protein RadA/Sms